MITTFLYVAAGLALALLLLWWWLRETRSPRAPAGRVPQLQDVARLHYERFPQMRQALAGADEAFLRQRAAPERFRQWQRERRGILLRFLAGLQEDHARLRKLVRALARLSPQVSHRQELELIRQALRFRLLYALVWCRIRAGWKPEEPLLRLAGRISALAQEIERGMAALEESARAGVSE